MDKKREHNLNITLQSEEEKNDFIISIGTIFRKLKKYVLIWLVVAVIVFVAILGNTALNTVHRKPALRALVSFTFDGIEKGLDPAGQDFNKEMIRNPIVIERALTSLDMPLDQLDNIRNSITITGQIPADAMDKILTYKNVYENANSNNLQAAQAMLSVPYFATEYVVTFNYSGTSLGRNNAVEVINTILEEFKSYFFDIYGYNESLGNSVSALDISSYDYSEAIEVLDNSLDTMSKYLKQLSKDDKTRFRSSVTGYTFDDLYEAIETIRSIDLDKVSSYVNVNNLTKDRDSSIAYYEYRINTLTRRKTSIEEQLVSVRDSIRSYEKDQIIIFGNGTDGTDTQSTQTSQQYDDMIAQKLELTNDLATTKQNINYYTERRDALKEFADNDTNNQKKLDQVDKQLEDVNKKITETIENVKLTADDYYENVTFQNAYNVLVPASTSMSSTISVIKNNVKMPLILGEGVVFAIYFLIAFLDAIKTDSFDRKKKKASEQENPVGEVAESI
ncbi:MAG: lipopolysaccharide biosynthesis protein [Ruminococcus sp.]|nr:lipopolysaccharide biosynthesis protein [Ruminococcus sp.]MDE6797103.1 lipopolysaccharide biosynthesis protein [Ruminococcus sp.]